MRRKTIYEYHRINKMKDEIDNGTAIWFKAQPTCNVKRTCEECVQLKVINSSNNVQYVVSIKLYNIKVTDNDQMTRMGFIIVILFL